MLHLQVTDTFTPWPTTPNSTDSNATVMSSSFNPWTVLDSATYPTSTNGSDALTVDHQASLNHLRWVAYGVVAPVIIATGVVGNVANLLVLSRPNLKSVTYVYLMWLAIVDLLCQLFVVPSMVNLSGVDFSTWSYAAAAYHAHVELAVINGLMAASVFIVVALTVDRFVSISMPTKFRKIHTFSRARLTISAGCVGALLINVPMCFYKHVVERRVGVATGTSHDDVTQTAPPLYFAEINKAVVNTVMWRVFLWTKEIVTRLAPAALLAALNVVIIYRFQQLVKKRRQRMVAQKIHQMASSSCRASSVQSSVTSSYQETPPNSTVAMVTTSSSVSGVTVSGVTVNGGGSVAAVSSVPPVAPSGGGGGGSFREERRLVILLAGIVVLFFVAMTPAAFLSLLNTEERKKDLGFQAFRAFANNMEFLNYAMNFYVYCLCSSEIRRTFLQLLCCNRLQLQEPLASTQQQLQQHGANAKPSEVLDN